MWILRKLTFKRVYFQSVITFEYTHKFSLFFISSEAVTKDLCDEQSPHDNTGIWRKFTFKRAYFQSVISLSEAVTRDLCDEPIISTQ